MHLIIFKNSDTTITATSYAIPRKPKHLQTPSKTSLDQGTLQEHNYNIAVSESGFHFCSKHFSLALLHINFMSNRY